MTDDELNAMLESLGIAPIHAQEDVNAVQAEDTPDVPVDDNQNVEVNYSVLRNNAEIERVKFAQIEAAFNGPDAPEPTTEVPLEKFADILAEVDVEFEAELLLRGLNESLEVTRDEFRAESETFKAMQDERDQIQKRLDEINRRLRAQDLLRKEVAEKGRKAREDVESAQRKLDVIHANKEAEETLKRTLSTFEARTVDSPWRTGKRLVNKKINPLGYYEVPLAMDHQGFASDRIASSPRFLCADGMGLGKTLTGVMAASKLDPGIKDPTDPTGERHLEGGKNPALRILMVGPLEGQTDVIDTFKMWSYYSTIALGRKTKFEQETLLSNIVEYNLRGVVVTMNYASWARNKNLLTWLNNVQFDMVIVDEAHHMKNVGTSTYKGIAEVVFNQNTCSVCGSLISESSDWECKNHCKDEDGYQASPVSSVRYFLSMTGTPILNRPQEIYASLHLARPDLFTSQSNFKYDYCGWSDDSWGPGGQARLAQTIGGFYMRRTRNDAGITLPKQSTYIHEIDITEDEFPLQFKIMQDLRNRATIEIEETESRTGQEFPQFNMLALITRQRQATVWPGGIFINEPRTDDAGWPIFDENNKMVTERVHIGQHYQESAKINLCMEIVDELREDDHIIVIVSQFLEALNETTRRAELRGLRVGHLHGGVSTAHKEDVKKNLLRRNNETPRYDIVVMHYETGGEALNLTAATAMIVLDEQWNEGKHDQATGRLDRTGQTEETQVHILRHVGPEESIDTWLQNLIEKKRKNVGSFNQAMSVVQEYKTAFGK